MNRLYAALVFVAAASPAVAQELTIDQGKLYVLDAKHCESIAKKGIDAFGEEDILTFSFEDGIQGMEFHCNIYDTKTKPNSSMILVETICEQPDIRYPDLLAITPMNDAGDIEIVSMNDSLSRMGSDEDGGYSGTQIFHKCDKLTGLPR